jgi:predicted transposase/invertase (TIGR01784 family)
MKTDSLFYRLFPTYPLLLFELIGYELNSPIDYGFRSVEIKQTAFRLDGVFVPPDDHLNLPLFFIEVQFQKEEAFYSRVFSEIFLYLRQYNPVNPWQAVIIYPSRSIDIGETRDYQELLNSPRVNRIYLNEIEEDDSSSLPFGLFSLIIASKKQAISQARELVNQTRERIETRQQQLQLFDLIETIIVYKLPRTSREEIQQMLNLTEIDLRQTQFYQDVFAEGRKEESLNLVLKLLTRRFGEIDVSMIRQIHALSLTELEQLTEALLDFTSIEDVVAWLANAV